MSFQEPGVFPVVRIPSIVRQPTLVRDHSLDLWGKKKVIPSHCMVQNRMMDGP